jgi:hypothetical protein
VYTELSEELNNSLHELSVGNIDLASRTYREAQRLVIGSVDERLTISTLEAGNAVACGLSRQTSEVNELKSVITLPAGKQRRNTKKIEKKTTFTVDKAGDITKPQHPEFATQLIEILGAVDINERIKAPDIFQQAAGLEDPIAFLRQKKLLLEDPLSELA